HRALSVRPSPPPLSTRFPYTTLFRSHGRAGQGIGDALCANWFEAREEGAISVERFFNDVGANRLNADTAGDVGACSVGKCLKAAVKSRCNHRLFYRMLSQDAGDECERTTVNKVIQSVHHKVDLPEIGRASCRERG